MLYESFHLGLPDYIKIIRPTNHKIGPHLHQCFEIIIAMEGEMTITIDSKSFLVKEKQAVLVFPNHLHFTNSISKHMACIFSSLLVPAYTTKVANRVPKSNLFQPDEYLIHAMSQLDDTTSIMEKKGVLYSLCAQFDKGAEYIPNQAKDENLLHKIFQFVEENFSGECSLEKLSTQIGYDYAYLSRYFKKTTGLTFNAYVIQHRLNHACYLMENTNLPIVQCAYESGFKSLRSFNRCFKDNYQITPSQYRKNLK